VIKSRRAKRAGQKARTREMRNEQNILAGKSENHFEDLGADVRIILE
jgi:hypothetical protein